MSLTLSICWLYPLLRNIPRVWHKIKLTDCEALVQDPWEVWLTLSLPLFSILYIPQSFCITAAWPTDSLVAYVRHTLEEVLPLDRDADGVFYTPSRLGYPDTRWGSLTLLQGCSQCILQPETNGPPGTCWESFTLRQRCKRCILQSQPTGLPGHSLGESYPSAEMQSVYSAARAEWATGHLLGEFYPSTEMQTVYSAVTADWATRTLVGGVLPFCRDAVSVFCSHIRLGHPDTRWGSLTLLQRCSHCILKSQMTEQHYY